MPAAQNEHFMRYTYVIANLHHRLVGHPHFLAYPYIVADLKPPWVFDIYQWLDINTFANLCPEHAEDSYLNTTYRKPRALKKNTAADKP